jgi:predicted transcriptional regulator
MQTDLDSVGRAVVKFLSDKGYLSSPMDVIDILTELRKALGAASLDDSTKAPAMAVKGASLAREAGSSETTKAPAAEENKPPAVDPRKSIHPDYLICLEDGQRVVLLRRHLKTRYNMTPDQYRIKWGLPDDYPMVAPNFAQKKSAFAKVTGFGRSHRKEFKEHYDQIKKRLKEGDPAVLAEATAGGTSAGEAARTR